ncbi:hypothetical protein ACQ5SK_09015 [Bradyrhizobium japonicum]
MLHAALDAPCLETIDRDARLHGDGAILVPAQRPVRRSRLVEQDSPDRATSVSKHRRGTASDISARGKERRETLDVSQPQPGVIGRQMGQNRLEPVQSIRGQCLPEQLRTIVSKSQLLKSQGHAPID